MDISVKDLQEAISIRQQIDNLQRRLSSLLRGAPPVQQRPDATSRLPHEQSLRQPLELVGQGGEAREEQPLPGERVSSRPPGEGSFRS